MKILVTGAAGFIGSHFVRHVLNVRPNAEVVIYDALRYSGNLSTMQDFWDRIRFYPGEIQNAGDVNNVIRIEKITHIVNFAAESHNDRSILDNSSFITTNVYGVQVLLDATKKNDIERFLQVSTDEVYGSINHGEFTESSPLEPNTPYSSSKASGELLCRAHYVSFQTPVVTTRGGNTYGTFHYPEKLIPYFVVRLLQGKKVPLYGEGTQVREWIHASDHASGIWHVLNHGNLGDAYNVGDINERQNIEVVRIILDELGLGDDKIRRIEDPRKGAHDARYSMSTNKIKELGWTPKKPFEESLRETVRWFRDNEWWWRPIIETPGYRNFESQFYGRFLGEDL